jgi:ligand-binding sensor domain-containing protein/serine phosphatase RsbU (regulator of sigma subunit)
MKLPALFPAFLTLLCIAFSAASSAQSFKFRTYEEQDGLASRYINTLNQDQNGYLIVGTGAGLYRFNGFKFTDITSADTLLDSHIICSDQQPSGAMWFGHNNGTVSIYQNGKHRLVAAHANVKSRIHELACTDDKVYALTQSEGILRLNIDGSSQLISQGLETYLLSSMVVMGNTVWLGSDMGLLRAPATATSEWQVTAIEGFPITNVTDLLPLSESSLLASTEDAGIWHISVQGNQTILTPLLCSELDLSTLYIKEIRIDAEKNLWVSTNNQGLVRLSEPIDFTYSKSLFFSEEGASSAMSVKTAFSDREGNLWIGTVGKGLLKLEDDYFALYTLPSEWNITALKAAGDTLWQGGSQLINVSSNQPAKLRMQFNRHSGIPETQVSCIHTDDEGNLWIGTTTSGLWWLKSGSKKFIPFKLSEDNLNKKVNAITSLDETVYLATDYGAYITRDGKVVNHLSIENGLSGNVVKSLYCDKQRRVWLGTTTSELAYIENGELRQLPSPLPGTVFSVRCIAQDENGDIWIGTEGFGIVNITHPKNYFVRKSDGLYSDYCYSLFCDAQNRLWAGHRGALSRFDIASASVEVFHPHKDEPVAFYENGITQSQEGFVFFATDHGILRYDPKKDRKNLIEPITNFDQIIINDSVYAIGQEFNLDYGQYKVEFFFTGVSLRKPDKVTYQYFLEGYDLDWSTMTSANFARYHKLGPGEYVFKVKTFNADGVGGDIVREIKIHIEQPFWMKWWFWLICAVIVFLSFRFIIMYRERRLRENQELLQQALDERTKEVVEQKELLELKNKDITDSILYAKNIQKAILPPRAQLKNWFTDAFVLFKPRDIVSGDFYWSARFGNKVLVACADCTGHGVPGAFMSLIGSTLLQQVARMETVQSPGQLLDLLDVEIFKLLNRKTHDFFVDDGMDISLVEYDVETHVARFSGANRPMLMMKDGKITEIKGDRRAIGGSARQENTSFTVHVVQLAPGDAMFLYSDGITDQFGGEEGKKLKRSGLHQWIEETAHLNMDEQHEVIRQKVLEWRGVLPQIDDIILLGMKVG